MKYFDYPKTTLVFQAEIMGSFRHQGFWIYVVLENIKDLGEHKGFKSLIGLNKVCELWRGDGNGGSRVENILGVGWG